MGRVVFGQECRQAAHGHEAALLCYTFRAMSPITRRQFIEVSGMMAGVCLWPRLALPDPGDPTPSVQFPSAAHDRVAVAAYPFREFIVGWKGWDGKTPNTSPHQIELKEFAAHVAEKFNVRKIELWSPIFPSLESKYLDELQKSIAKTGSAVVDIAVDAGHSQYALDAKVRAESVRVSKQWVDAAAVLGSPSIRVHINGSKDSKPDVGRAAETLARVAEYGAAKNVVIHLENDDPVSEDPFFISDVIEKVKSPWLRALPDFGNSLAARNDEDFQNRALETMFAHAYGICHVKETELDDKGKAVHVNMARAFEILKKHGYKGYCSIEYDSPGDPYKPTAELVEQTVKFLS